jgi:NAD+ synthase (glutamine-hydrolysing)
MGVVRVALAQINVTVGSLHENVEKIVAWAARAVRAGADIVTFPELAVCGYPPEDLLLKADFLEDNRTALKEVASRCKGITALVGFADHEDGKVYNAAALIHDGSLVDVYRKVELPNYGVFDEKRYFSTGTKCLVFDLNGARFSVTICEDVWVEGSCVEKFALESKAAASLTINASPFHAQKLDLRRRVLARFAAATHTTVFYNNLVGGQDDLVFDGGSLVMSPSGSVLAQAKRFEEDLLVTDFDVKDGLQINAEPDLASIAGRPLRLETLGPLDRKDVAPMLAPEIDPIEEIYKALVLGTRDYLRKNNFEKVVIGLSGGIDSALTAGVAVEAVGNGNVIGVTMPSQYTSGETLSDAGRLADNLGIRLITVPIRETFLLYLDTIELALGEGLAPIAAENLQARIRGNIIMALSNTFGWLVLTTGNKSEIAVGYCTLYGDTAGGFAVIKDVPKTVVYELAEYVNDRAGREVIPLGVIRRPPTAELRPDQKDEDSLPQYAILDPILRAYVEEDRALDDIAAQGYDPAVVEDVIRLVDRNEYKRRQAPPGVKITPKAFGRDRRLPITNGYRGFKRGDRYK